MRVGVFQFAPEFGRVDDNVTRIERALIASEPADLWVLPELATTGYRFVDRDEALALAEPLDGPSIARLCSLSGSLGATLVVGFAEREGDRLYNSAFVARDGKAVFVYRKSHLFEDEPDWCLPGDTGFRVLDVGGVKLGVMICFDWRFPEAARALALAGAEIIAHPCCLVRPQGPDVMKVRALENAVFAVTANRVGVEARPGLPALRFTGKSQIADPSGELRFRLGDDEEGTRVAEIALAESHDKRRGRNDLFADRRPELYGGLVAKRG